MSISLSDLKKSKASRLENLINKSKQLDNPGEKEKDGRFWQPSVDAAGNGSAVIRFLPAAKVDGLERLPWASYFQHAFKGPSGKWYIEKSLTTLGKADPVGEYNSKLWNTEEKHNQDQAREQKRKLNYVANIRVINDPAHPENNGKVFLFRFGKKIFEKIKNVMTPDEDLGEEPNDPFDFWTGQNFKLKIKNVSGYRNYDDSGFANPSPISKDDKEIEAIWESEYSLNEFDDPSSFKSYEELRAKLYQVLEIRDETIAQTAERVSLENDDMNSAVSDDEEPPFDTNDDSGSDDTDLDEILKGL